MPMLETESVSKVYRSRGGSSVRAVDSVTLAIEPGAVAVLTGPSGSGKTTLLALLAALDRPTAGRVRFAGADLSGCSDAELARVRRRTGFVFQDFALVPTLTATENVTYPLIARGVPRSDRLRRSSALLDRFGIAARRSARASELSGGERQRVALARALAGDPEVLFADEPTSNLDPDATRTVLDVLREVHANGKTVVLSSHDPAVVALATRTFALAAGRLEGTG